jgi:antitoxin MazE
MAGTVVKTRIVRIGNSQGVRIPKALLDQSGLGEDVEMEAQEHQIVIRSRRRPREGWDEQFRAMAEHGDDRLLGEEALCLSDFDEAEWEW